MLFSTGTGIIINISSDLGIIAPDQRLYHQEGLSEEKQSVKPVSYSVTKHAIIGLTKYLATYWAHNGVRSNTLCPGGVFADQPDDFVEKVSKLIPLGKMANNNQSNKMTVCKSCNQNICVSCSVPWHGN